MADNITTLIGLLQLIKYSLMKAPHLLKHSIHKNND